jgi:mono/diheme cytochrome c family protein
MSHWLLAVSFWAMKILKWIGIGVGSLLGVAIVLVLVLFLVGRSKAGKAPDVAGKAVPVNAGDTAAVARGGHIAKAIGACEECHGPDLGGKAFPTPGILVSMAAPNLTRGQGGIGASYTAEDWERAIRHGIAKDGRRLIIMPSEAYTHLSDSDAAALIAYLQSIPAVDRTFEPRSIGLLGGALVGVGAFPTAPDIIAHDSVGTRAVVAPAVNAEYGGYLARVGGCTVCHGPDLRGGKPGGGGPPPAPSLVAFIANNSAEAFKNTLRTGKTPSGRELDPKLMPWQQYGRMTDAEMDAIRLYVLSVIDKPAAPTTTASR